MSDRRPARRRRTAWIVGVLLVGLATTAVALRPWEPSWRFWETSAAAEEVAEPVTATVERASLVSRVRLGAQLGYGEPVSLPASSGMLTVLPTPGQVVKTGKQVYEADGDPVVLFRGTRPFWRDLSVDSTRGEDVRQLEQNLTSLGFFRGEPDTRYTWATWRAVRDWQASLGVERTGAFSAASVVTVDAPSIRIAQVQARLGESGASPGTYTETTLRATARLTAAQARELVAGTPVTVVLPDGTEIDTTLAAVDPGGTPTGDGDAVTPPVAVVEFDEQSVVAETGPAAVRIVIRDDEEQPETLVVPVTALLATAQDGYAVEVLEGSESVRVPVEIGLVADARVQVLRSGAELEASTGPAGDAGRVLSEGDTVVLAR